MKYCLLCNPDDNGTRGEQGTNAVAKYYLPQGPNQISSGWIPVCLSCADSVKQYYTICNFDGTDYIFQDGEEEIDINSGPYKHDWGKTNLVTQEDSKGRFFDLMECSKCGGQTKRYGLGQDLSNKGCSEV
jgi:hypothetical protein